MRQNSVQTRCTADRVANANKRGGGAANLEIPVRSCRTTLSESR